MLAEWRGKPKKGFRFSFKRGGRRFLEHIKCTSWTAMTVSISLLSFTLLSVSTLDFLPQWKLFVNNFWTFVLSFKPKVSIGQTRFKLEWVPVTGDLESDRVGLIVGGYSWKVLRGVQRKRLYINLYLFSSCKPRKVSDNKTLT